jgi:hypothetical protein
LPDLLLRNSSGFMSGSTILVPDVNKAMHY